MTSKNYFKLLSVESIEHILLQFIRPADLLSLALTERRLSSIIIPDFLEYCCLVFNIGRWDVWEHLVKQPLACSRIGRLELAIEDLWWPRAIPATIMLPQSLRLTTLGNCPDEELGSNTICSALTQMSNLKQIVITSQGDRASIQELFALVGGVCGSGCGLERINVGLNYCPSWAVTESGLSLVKMLYNASWLSHVKIFRLSLFYFSRLGQAYNLSALGPELNFHLLGVILQMPNLTHLQLETPDRRPLLDDDMVHKWSKLEFLQLGTSFTTSYGSSLTTIQHFDLEAFAAGHPRLHTVHLCLEGVILVQKPSLRNTNDKNIVPALKNLTYTSYMDMIPGSLKEARLLLRNLSHLTITPLDSSTFSIIGELELLESCVILGSSVKVEPAVISTVFRGCKSLRKLSFCSSYMTSLTMNESFALFQDLPNLTHLFGTSSQDRSFPGPDGDAVLKTLYKFPKLRFIDCFYDDVHEVLGKKQGPRDNLFHHMFVELRRNDILKQMSYEFLESRLLPRSCRQNLWEMCCNFWETI